MKLILDIKDNKAAFIMELLGNFNFVKAAPLGKHDAAMFETLTLAVEEVNDIKAGRKASQSLTSFFKCTQKLKPLGTFRADSIT